MIYKHTQTGYLMIIALIIPLFILYFAMSIDEFCQVLPIVFFTLLIVLTLFYSLTVEIDETRIVVKFGFGIINKKFVLKDIESCRVVRNYWYYGWGIRWTPHGWLYNISGLSAVEIQMKNGKKYRIGTDEPKNLEHVIIQTIK
ncbi:hypothetical protein K8R61_02675 [bacterium]|nr:hypothetical protein [bacterium]